METGLGLCSHQESTAVRSPHSSAEVEVLLGTVGQYCRPLTHFPSHLTQIIYLLYPSFHPLQVYCPLFTLCVTRFTLNLQALGLARGSGNRQIPVSSRPSWLDKGFQNSQDCIVTLCLRKKRTNNNNKKQTYRPQPLSFRIAE